MALTFSPSTIHPVDTYGAMPIRFVTAVPATSDYATGGYVLTAGTGIPLGSIYFTEVVGDTGGTTAVWGKWNFTTSKLQFFWTGASSSAVLAEVTNGTDLSATTFTLRITGINP